MVVLIIFPVILQTVINVIMLSIGGWGDVGYVSKLARSYWSVGCRICVKDMKRVWSVNIRRQYWNSVSTRRKL